MVMSCYGYCKNYTFFSFFFPFLFCSCVCTSIYSEWPLPLVWSIFLGRIPCLRRNFNCDKFGGVHLKRVQGFVALKTYFSRLSCRSQDPHLKEENYAPLQSKTFFFFFLENDNFQLQKLKFDRNFRQTDWRFSKIPVLKPLFSMKIRSQAAPTTFMVIYPHTKPQVRKSRQHIPTRKRKLSAPGDKFKNWA